MKNTNATGAIAEGHVLAALLAKGKTVLMPFGVQAYDLVLHDEKGFTRLQVKTIYRRDGQLVFDAYSKTGDDRTTKKRYTSESIDVFAAYDPVTANIYLVPIEDVTTWNVCLRITPTRNNQASGVRWAKDYLLDR